SLDPLLKLDKADVAPTKGDRRARAEIGGRRLHQVRQCSVRDRRVAADPRRIEFFAGINGTGAARAHRDHAVAVSDAKVLPSSARRLSNGAGSSEGSPTALA